MDTRNETEMKSSHKGHGSSTAVPLQKKDIEAGLRHIGLVGGEAVEVHSSLSSFG